MHSKIMGAQDPKSDGANRRNAGRVLLQEVGCSAGEVLDLSASGMRIRMKTKPGFVVGEPFGLRLNALVGPILVPVKAVWIRKVGWRKHEAGLHFLEVNAELRRSLCDLARSVSSNEMIRPELNAWRQSA